MTFICHPYLTEFFQNKEFIFVQHNIHMYVNTKYIFVQTYVHIRMYKFFKS